MTAVPVSEEGMGSAVNDTIRELGGTLGVGIMGSLQAGTYTTGLTDALRGSYLPQDILGASKESVMAAESISAPCRAPCADCWMTRSHPRSWTGCTASAWRP